MGKKSAGQNFLQGAAVLVAATLLVKLIGALFKIPLNNLIGNVASGYFGSAYNLFVPIYSVCVAGMPVAVARMVAETSVRGRYRDSRKIFRVALLAFFVVGIVAMILLAAFAQPFVTIQKSPGAIWAVLAIAPAVFFGCIMSAYRGYYEGLRNMNPTAVSQIIEALIKLLSGLAMAFVIIKIAQGQYAADQTVFGIPIEISAELTGQEKIDAIREKVLLAAAPYTALAATLGVTVSTLVGTLCLMIWHKLHGDNITREELIASPRAMSGKILLIRLLKIAIPVSIGSLATNLTTIIDLISIKGRLNDVAKGFTDVIMGMYGEHMTADIPVGMIADELWGVYSVAVLSLFNLVPSLCVAFGKSALPNITVCWTKKDLAGTKRNVESVLRITALLAIPAGIGLCVLSKPVMQLLYNEDTAAIGSPILAILGIACIFVSITTPVYNMLQAVGKINVPVILMIAGALIKLICNFVFVGIPELNIRGAAIGTLICYVVILTVALVALCRRIRVVPNMVSVFVKPLIAAVLMGGGAWAVNGLLRHVLPEKLGDLVTLAAILIGVIIYVVSLILLRAISKDDILMLPKGEKIAKVLEKRGIIG